MPISPDSRSLDLGNNRRYALLRKAKVHARLPDAWLLYMLLGQASSIPHRTPLMFAVRRRS